MKRWLALMLALVLLPTAAGAIEDCHRVEVTKQDTRQDNQSFVRLWQVDTALDTVDAELAAIAEEYV